MDNSRQQLFNGISNGSSRNATEHNHVKQHDILHHSDALHSGDVTIGECDPCVPTSSTTTAAASAGIAAGNSISAARRASTGQAHNIPYMQLFHHLKQKFPDLKDCDINESIQKFGLDRVRCESELQLRAQGHNSGYYGPWGRTINWSSRSSPATPTQSAGGTPFTTPNTPALSPLMSPFASQVPAFHNVKSAPSHHNDNLTPLTVVSAIQHGDLSTALQPEDVATSPLRGSAILSSCFTRSPTNVAQVHTATTRHYVVSPSQPIPQNTGDLYRQCSTSTEPITEDESVGGSNLTSPTSTLPLSPSPQPRGRSHTPLHSPHIAEQHHYPNIAVQNCMQPMMHQLQYPRTSIYQPQYHDQAYVYQTPPQVFGWNPSVNSMSQGTNIPRNNKPLNELNNEGGYSQPNSNQIDDSFSNPTFKLENQGRSRPGRSGIPPSRPRSEYIPNICPLSNNNSNSNRRSRSSTPGVPASAPGVPASAPVVTSYEPFGSYIYHHGETRRLSDRAEFEPVRVAPHPPVSPYLPLHGGGGAAGVSSRLSNLHIQKPPDVSGASPTITTVTTSSAQQRPTSILSSAAKSTGNTPTRAGLVSEQRNRQQRLQSVLQEGMRECEQLQGEVNKITQSLNSGRLQAQQAAQASAQRIEEMQEDNRRLQSEVDQMEGEIMQTGEEPELLDGEVCPPVVGGSLLREGSSSSYSVSSPPSPLPPLPTPASSRGLPAVGEIPRLLTPTRLAPPPPPPAAAPAPAPHRSTLIIQNESTPSNISNEGAGHNTSSGSNTSPTGWSCSRCTYDNHPDMQTCEICGAIRLPPLPPSIVPPPSQQASQAIGRVTGGPVWPPFVNDSIVGSPASPPFAKKCSSFLDENSMLFPDKDASGKTLSPGAIGIGLADLQENELKARNQKIMSVDGSIGIEGCGNDVTGIAASNVMNNELPSVKNNNENSSCLEFNDDTDSTSNTPMTDEVQNSGSFSNRSENAAVPHTNPITSDILYSQQSVFHDKYSRSNNLTTSGSHDDLDTFRFVAGLSHGMLSSPRSFNSKENTNSPRIGTVTTTAGHDDCFCHPRPAAHQHRRSGSGGTFSFLDKIDKEKRRHSGGAGLGDASLAGASRSLSGLTNVGHERVQLGRLKPDESALDRVRNSSGSSSSGYNSQTNRTGVSGNDCSQIRAGVSGNDSSFGLSNQNTNNGDICSSVSSNNSNDDCSRTSSGGSRSFGFDNTFLGGYPFVPIQKNTEDDKQLKNIDKE